MGRSNAVDEMRSGRPVEIAQRATVRWGQEMIWVDRSVTIDIIGTAIGYCHVLAYTSFYDRLNLSQMCSRCVPRELAEEYQKSFEWTWPYFRYAERDMLNIITTGNEDWLYHCQPETNLASIQWKHPSFPLTEKFNAALSAGKVVISVLGHRRSDASFVEAIAAQIVCV